MSRTRLRGHKSIGLFGIAAICFAVGCGGGGDNRASITGNVSLDGAPVENGTIRFLAENGPTAGGTITAGKYEIPPTLGPMVGKNKVEIRAEKKTGKQIPVGSPAPAGTMMDETVESIPDQYNTKSTLTVDVVAGKNTKDFDLKK
ncbi:hypothetical protein SH661x_003576 [Planctomicrobium sp. SH661]|uniref:hypothetical protein n=1 Tax=Planctomicrobium sp. SH661 TaxID=3448124 RepID=UPI003F5B7A0C